MFKHPYFHTFEFNCSLIVAFFIACVAVTCAMLPALGLHRLGTMAGDELSQYSDPPKRHRLPTERPSPPQLHGIPVAMQTEGASR